ncbi:MAG: hypothetical protein KDA68_24760, partial [Planctomycetaceae bacterium]|nr:hypothetical protein [Planctomycetaceae bacterium]
PDDQQPPPLPPSASKKKYAEADEYIDYQIHKTQAGVKRNDLLTSCTFLCAFIIAYLLIFAFLDSWVIPGGFPLIARWLLAAILVVGAIWWTFKRIAVPAIKSINSVFAARIIETADPTLKGNLLNLVDLEAAGRAPSPAVQKAMQKRAAVKLSEVNPEDAVDGRPLIRSAY